MPEVKLKVRDVYKLMLCLYCIILACRELFQSMGEAVFIFLALLFFIPFAVLAWDFFLNPKFSLGTFLFLLLGSFYVFIYPVNINGLLFFLPMICAGLAFRRVEYSFLTKCFLITQIVCLLLRVYLINLGAITEKELGAEWKVDDGRSVFDLGYGNSNSAGMTFFFLCCMIYCYGYERKKWLSFVLILAVSYFSYYYTASRTAFFSSLLLLLAYFIPPKTYMFFKQKWILMLIPLIVAFPLLIVPFSSSIAFLDQFLSSRIYYMFYMLSLFKSPVSFITGVFVEENNSFPIDNVFSFLLMYGGLVAIVSWGVFYMAFVRQAKQMPFYIVVLLVVIVLSGVGESSWATFGRLGSSFFWLLLLNKTVVPANRN